jgi:Tfp pilus assembly protein PilV
MRIGAQNQSGATLVELVTAAFLILTSFVAVFEINAVCLRYISAGKESTAAISVANDRAESLRNLAFYDLTNAAVVSGLLASPANSSPFASRATEVVKISAYPTANGVTRCTRNSDGTVTVNSVAADLGRTLVKLETSCSWTSTHGSRARSEEVVTIISSGTKK